MGQWYRFLRDYPTNCRYVEGDVGSDRKPHQMMPMDRKWMTSLDRKCVIRPVSSAFLCNSERCGSSDNFVVCRAISTIPIAFRPAFCSLGDSAY